jgi:hypothetical protein
MGMALTEGELDLSDGLSDLIGVALDIAESRVDERRDWFLVASERLRRSHDPPMAGELADWPNDAAQFVTQHCPTLEQARKVAYDALAPGAHWRAVVVWRAGDTVRVQAQDAERDQVAVIFTYPIRRRSLRRPVLVRDHNPWDDHEQTAPLRAPTWDGTRWTLRASDRVVADLEVLFTDPPQLYAEIQPREGFEAVRPAIERFQVAIAGHGGRWYWEADKPDDVLAALADVHAAVTLHDPHGSPIPGYELHLGGLARWWWPGSPFLAPTYIGP